LIENWEKSNPYTFIKYPSRECQVRDFGQDQKSVKFFNSWKGFYMLCPDVNQVNATKKYRSQEQPLYLDGVLGGMQAESVQFSIERCKNTTENKNHCHSVEDIDEYMQVMTVDYWTI